MRRVSGELGDVFRPRGQLARDIDLAKEATSDVIRILGQRLSEERKQRIDRVVAARTHRLAIAVEGVNDPHNTAAVIRTSEAFGVQNVHVIERGNSFLSSRRVTQGTHKWVDLFVWKNFEGFVTGMQKEGKKILVADSEATLSLDELNLESTPLALVFGNEHEGVSPKLREAADSTFCIPMCGFAQSLNVSVAAAVVIAALRKDGCGSLSVNEQDILRARFYLRAVRAGYDIVIHEQNAASTSQAR